MNAKQKISLEFDKDRVYLVEHSPKGVLLVFKDETMELDICIPRESAKLIGSLLNTDRYNVIRFLQDDIGFLKTKLKRCRSETRCQLIKHKIKTLQEVVLGVRGVK